MQTCIAEKYKLKNNIGLTSYKHPCKDRQTKGSKEITSFKRIVLE